MKAFCGTLAALALLALGLYFMPAPGIGTAGGIFAAFWVLVALASAVAFGRELILLLQMNRIRARWRPKGKKLHRRTAFGSSPLTHLRERERHLD